MDTPPERKSGFSFRRYLLAGLAAILPAFITFYLIVLVLRVANRFGGQLINDLLAERYGFVIPGIGVLILLVLILLVGAFVSNFFGRRIFAAAESFFSRTPFVANIYRPAKKLSDFLFKEEAEKKFRKVVLVEYPAPGSYSIGFLTNEGIAEFNRRTGAELVTVLVPLSPMPYSGILLILPREKLIEVDMDIQDALKLVLSSGVVVPDER